MAGMNTTTSTRIASNIILLRGTAALNKSSNVGTCNKIRVALVMNNNNRYYHHIQRYAITTTNTRNDINSYYSSSCSRSVCNTTSRSFTSSAIETENNPTLTSAQTKFVNLFLNCRERSFGAPLFSRYVKEMIYAIDANHDGMISPTELEQMMEYIGVEKRLTNHEMEILFQELGENVGTERLIPIHTVEQLVLEHINE